MPDFATFLATTNISLSAREEWREGKGPGKLQGTTGCDAQDLRMMGSHSHCESRRYRSQSDTRECSDHRPVCTGGSIVHINRLRVLPIGLNYCGVFTNLILSRISPHCK